MSFERTMVEAVEYGKDHPEIRFVASQFGVIENVYWTRTREAYRCRNCGAPDQSVVCAYCREVVR